MTFDIARPIDGLAQVTTNLTGTLHAASRTDLSKGVCKHFSLEKAVTPLTLIKGSERNAFASQNTMHYLAQLGNGGDYGRMGVRHE